MTHYECLSERGSSYFFNISVTSNVAKINEWTVTASEELRHIVTNMPGRVAILCPGCNQCLCGAVRGFTVFVLTDWGGASTAPRTPCRRPQGHVSPATGGPADNTGSAWTDGLYFRLWINTTLFQR